MIETYGLVVAIEGADSMLKAANVDLVGKYKVGAGIVTIIVKGDVGSVNASVSAGKISAEKLGKVISTHVIPRPADEIYSIFENRVLNDKEFIRTLEDEVFEDKESVEASEDEVLENKELIENIEFEETDLLDEEKLLNKLSLLKFSELRKMAKRIMEQVPVERLTEKGSKLHSKKDVLEFLINFKELL